VVIFEGEFNNQGKWGPMTFKSEDITAEWVWMIIWLRFNQTIMTMGITKQTWECDIIISNLETMVGWSGVVGLYLHMPTDLIEIVIQDGNPCQPNRRKDDKELWTLLIVIGLQLM
jgi:hypothetical protein